MKKRLLFVDDEPNILQGLKRMLRSHRDKWDMAFAEGGQQALEIMQQESFDAVVSDMRMPGMDGAQLLEEISQRHPDTVRIVLSGHSGEELVMRSVGPSHQYLAKPCEPELLETTLNSAFALRDRLGDGKLRTLISGLTSLPSLPVVYNEVVQKLRSDDASVADIGEIIAGDPGLMTKIIQLVNSAYFGLARNVSSPAEAAAMLGIDTLKGLVLSIGIFSQFEQSTLDRLAPVDIWNHSLTVGKLAKSIAKSQDADKLLMEQAYMGGMLHDMGHLILAANLPDEYSQIKHQVSDENLDLLVAEERVVGATHADVGAYLLSLWGIPQAVVAAVGYHHRPAKLLEKEFSAVTAVYAAEVIVHGVSEEPGADSPAYSEFDLEYLEGLGLADRLPEWITLFTALEEDAA